MQFPLLHIQYSQKLTFESLSVYTARSILQNFLVRKINFPPDSSFFKEELCLRNKAIPSNGKTFTKIKKNLLIACALNLSFVILAKRTFLG